MGKGSLPTLQIGSGLCIHKLYTVDQVKGYYILNSVVQGCVYLKMNGIESAVKAYKGLHGGWYKGEIWRYIIELWKYHQTIPLWAHCWDVQLAHPIFVKKL